MEIVSIPSFEVIFFPYQQHSLLLTKSAFTKSKFHMRIVSEKSDRLERNHEAFFLLSVNVNFTNVVLSFFPSKSRCLSERPYSTASQPISIPIVVTANENDDGDGDGDGDDDDDVFVALEGKENAGEARSRRKKRVRSSKGNPEGDKLFPSLRCAFAAGMIDMHTNTSTAQLHS